MLLLRLLIRPLHWRGCRWHGLVAGRRLQVGAAAGKDLLHDILTAAQTRCASQHLQEDVCRLRLQASHNLQWGVGGLG
jgi:hypothetical protein